MTKKTLYLNGKLICEYDAPADQQADMELCREMLKQRGLWETISRERVLFNQAVAFASTSAMIWTQKLGATPAQDGNAAVPFVVNSSFATELYLKAIALVNGKKLHGHELDHLFKKIPSAGQAVIERKLVEQIPKDQWQSTIRSMSDLVGLFQRHRDTFKDWRYLHEHERVGEFHFRDAIFAMQVLHETCLAYSQIVKNEPAPITHPVPDFEKISMAKIPTDSTIASVWPHLTDPRSYVAGARQEGLIAPACQGAVLAPEASGRGSPEQALA